ncbi:MAG: hypothetical protein BWY87_00830 [Deltaproteobacteria bacterium ADurb.Bin510]|nr:MAG: hypothetical protein BWY87_00830 [Deltaproteobacteria bacterium ADurb.Bin510]
MKNKRNEQLYQLAYQTKFVDPSTKLPPRDERSLSALLCIYHQLGNIVWNEVELFDVDLLSCGDASCIFSGHGVICSEYPLFWSDPGTCSYFGDMRPDLIYFSDDGQSMAIIENKIGAGYTHSGDEFGGQLGRYILYLKHSVMCNKTMILLTSKNFVMNKSPWYINELGTAIKVQKSADVVTTRIMFWEDILQAFVA